MHVWVFTLSVEEISKFQSVASLSAVDLLNHLDFFLSRQQSNVICDNCNVRGKLQSAYVETEHLRNIH